MVNVTSRNNILDVKRASFRNLNNDPLADYDYDLYRGTLPKDKEHEKHGIADAPNYAVRSLYALARKSPGHDAGVRIANFNGDFRSEAPDVGAHELGTKSMEFGVNSYKYPKRGH